LSAGVLVVAILVLPSRLIKAVLRFVPLVWIGRISYGLYLWHWPVKWFVYRQGNGPDSNFQMLIAILLSVGLPTLSYYLVEKRFLRWKGRFTTRTAEGSLNVET
jgi:peptidoglycan/LPS O-acetylase OafA/YrhL